MPQLTNQQTAELIQQLQAVQSYPEYTQHQATEKIHVTGVGRRFYVAYEQLRNAAEYTEDHLLLRRAIGRFFRRSRVLHERHRAVGGVGVALVSELTQAGYIANDSIAHPVAVQLEASVKWHTALFAELHHSRKVSNDQATRWIIESLSVECERILRPRYGDEVCSNFIYQHLLHAIRRLDFSQITDEWTYYMSVYCAMHRSLYKSDMATVRYWLLRACGRKYDQPEEFIALNVVVEEIFHASETARLMRLIRHYGAPLKMLRGVVRESADPAALLADPAQMITAVGDYTQQEYGALRRRLQQGITRSIIFIFITKMIIGLGIEIPYDLVHDGGIALVPLLANLLFPPLYMASLGWRISLPDSSNVAAIKQQCQQILYSTGSQLVYARRRRVTSSVQTAVFNVVYVAMFLLSFSLLLWALYHLRFGVVQGFIFFIFLSTVSFLGFRLAQNVREVEFVDSSQGFVGIVSDFLYTPFVRVGQWIADKYSRVNLITMFLDMAIELPLKSFLYIVGQWVSFLRDKREEI